MNVGLAEAGLFRTPLAADIPERELPGVFRKCACATTLAMLMSLMLTTAPPLIAQAETSQDRLIRLMDNRDQLDITLQIADLDQIVPPAPAANPKTTWMSGSPVQVVVYITNPTAAALEIPDPFDTRADELRACYREATLADGNAVWQCGDQDSPPVSTQLDVPSRFINPGETLVVIHKSTELVSGSDEFWLGEGGLPRSEGHYSFGYLGDMIEFDIQAPIPLTSVLVPLHAVRTYVDTVQNTGATDVLNMVVFSVSDNGWPTICWSIGDVEGPIDFTVGPQGRLDPVALNTVMPIGVYALPAAGGAAPGPIKTLTASADSSDRITIDYSGNDGVHHLLQLNSSRRLAKPNDETISTPSAPSGPASGSVDSSYQYGAGGATSSLGHPIQYIFDWGDGTYSDWLDAGTSTAPQSWSTAAFYPVAVIARCVNDGTISSMSPALMVTIGGGSLPTIGGVSPSHGVQGTSVQITMAGTNFFPGATVATNNSGITVSNVILVSLKQIKATLTIGANATLGATNITVTTGGGSSVPFGFSVDATAPTLSGVNPASGVRGTTVPVTLTGSNFVTGATVGVNNTGITVGNVTVVSGTQITATFTIAATATVGPANVTVTAGGGTTSAVTFTVNPSGVKPMPTITWSNPADILFGSALVGQLNATADVPGIFVYTPPTGTVPLIGNGQTLSVIFTPTDSNYSAASKSVTINVLSASAPGSPANLVPTKVLVRDGTGQVVVTVTFANTGGTDVQNFVLTAAKIGTVLGTPLPQAIGAIAPGTIYRSIVTFPGTVGASGASTSLTLSGTFTGGTFGSTSRITLP